jgi:hypothetical protein
MNKKKKKKKKKFSRVEAPREREQNLELAARGLF